MGDILIDGPRAGQVAFWHFERSNGQIAFYDLDTEQIIKAPAGVNTAKSEGYVSMSGEHLLFGRGPLDTFGNTQVLLHRFGSRSTTTIASASAPVFLPDQVNDDYAVYTRMTRSGADVYRYRISTGRRTKIPPAALGRANYYAGVLADGTVFFVQGNAANWGKNTRILRLRNGNLTTVASFPDGIELASLNAREIDGEIHVAFSRVVCANGKGGINEVVL